MHIWAWDAAEHPEAEEYLMAYLNVALDEGGLNLIMAPLGNIDRARRMAMPSQETEPGRESLYKSLSTVGNPDFTAVLKVMHVWDSHFRPQQGQERTTLLDGVTYSDSELPIPGVC